MFGVAGWLTYGDCCGVICWLLRLVFGVCWLLACLVFLVCVLWLGFLRFGLIVVLVSVVIVVWYFGLRLVCFALVGVLSLDGCCGCG